MLSEISSIQRWYGNIPKTKNKIALLIPQFNENSNCKMVSRLNYFKLLAREVKTIVDVIIIDDGSTDDSWEIIKKFKDENPDAFYVSSINPNGKKIGAIYKTFEVIKHEFIILSDFDTNLYNLAKIQDVIIELRKNPSLMGCYFKMLPSFGNGLIFHFQKIEYALTRCLYKLVELEKSVPVMPGAGSFYKRIHLNIILQNHSGRWNGEDREITLIGLRLGYQVFYEKEILALTKPPRNFQNLVKQRIRWYLGYIETLHKEKIFYLSEILKFSRIGIRTGIDLLNTILIILMPIILLILGITNLRFLFLFITFMYLLFIGYYLICRWLNPNEFKEINLKYLGKVLITYPIIKIILDYWAWSLAIFRFFETKKSTK